MIWLQNRFDSGRPRACLLPLALLIAVPGCAGGALDPEAEEAKPRPGPDSPAISPQESRSPAASDSGSPAGESGAAAVVLEMLRVYRSARGLREEAEESILISQGGRQRAQTVDQNLSYQAPNRFRYELHSGRQAVASIVSDGKMLRSLFYPDRLLLVADAPERLEGSADLLRKMSVSRAFDPFSFVVGQDPLEGMTARLVGNRSSDTYQVDLESEGGSATTLWIGRSDHLLRRVHRVIQQSGGRIVVDRTTERTQIDPPLLGRLFTLRVPAGVRRREVPTPVGEPARVSRLKDLDGNRVDLRALKGNVVLLNFWAHW